MDYEKKFKIIGTPEMDYEWYEKSVSAGEYGEMIVYEYKVQIRIGAVWYLIEQINNISVVKEGTFKTDNWIKIEYTTRGRNKTIYICSGVLGGIRNLLGTDINYMMNVLYDFMERTRF